MSGLFQDNYNYKGIAIANIQLHILYINTYSASSNIFLNLILLGCFVVNVLIISCVK